ncbi:hypothetical protein ZYGR_0AD01760 [Zygosaccharomyces rouxii]|uniref:arginyltransferase n=2 Tax=Zygosaccharomyces rouxii TaxID=4956 RepID=C5E060_ZYGRC|nr:uncharacterized protein ZYRO0G10010g [Zygosaccharomyces rouxii]KAH9202489.1 arginine-tRNA-protein transferase [Zygosaccharomyces rouxii]GAV50993.1 hypothetical protein ZYGR_0AD01760 [Zygosaccharomyces rouxii]CAR29494.1 ZYRO0G10010p [Zygosaccharomyces rouxii]
MTERLIISEPYYFSDSISHCGYCKGQKPDKNDNFAVKSWYDKHSEAKDGLDAQNCTLGVQAELVSVEMYDRLCNMGFRRSGKFLYKPDLLRNCCRMYTIRTTTDQVRVSKDMKTCVKRFKKAVSPEYNQENKKDHKGPFNFTQEIIDTESKSDNFYTKFEPAVYSDEKYRLFAKYQESVHNDFDHNAKSFKRFLCDAPFSPEVIRGTKQEWDQLNDWKNPERSHFERVGPAHECYYYNGNLIAIAVIDILPSGISSVYFIWDPEYGKLSLGKLSALRELAISSKINRKHYYMGYYIQDCPKMNYKGKYGGELMDLCNYRYTPLTRVEKEIDHSKFFVLSDDPNLTNEPHLNERFSGTADVWQTPGSLHNVVENIYGVNGGAFKVADDAAEQLSRREIPYSRELTHDICNDGNGKNDIYRIPNVVPGLLPLEEILQMVLQKKINLVNNSMVLFDTSVGHIRLVVDFDSESPKIKKAVCDLVRLFGLQNTMDSLVIV